MLLGSTVTADPKSIREVDFNNFSYPWDGEPYRAVSERWSWISPFPQSKVTLTQGRKDLSPPDQNELGCPYLMFRSVTHGDLDGDGRDEAAVDLLYARAVQRTGTICTFTPSTKVARSYWPCWKVDRGRMEACQVFRSRRAFSFWTSLTRTNEWATAVQKDISVFTIGGRRAILPSKAQELTERWRLSNIL